VRSTSKLWVPEGRTDALAWDRWAEALALGAIEAQRVLVVAPHPDDETFGCGGLIAELSARSIEVTVVTVSDGAASHPEVADLAVQRRAEQCAACVQLGVAAPPTWLGLPDGDLTARAGAIDELLAPFVDEADLVVGPWAHDGHPDHEVVGAVVASLASQRGCRSLAYPVWWWRWGLPKDLGAARAVRIDLGDAAIAAKRAAMGCFATQTTDVLGEVIVDAVMLDRFARPFEVLVDA
jgi:LmbE family N-acetylglucosaminyl deacetylase